MIVVIEPGQRSIDSARRVLKLSNEIGLKNIRFVANKVNGPNDEQFIRDAFPEHELLGIILYSEEIRKNDRNGHSILDGLRKETIEQFERILKKLTS
jgi:CO dehydrogenase maturation factor